MTNKIFRFLPVLVLVLAMAACESDDITGFDKGSLSVAVQDTLGAPIVGAEVAVFNLDTRTSISDQSGTASFSGLATVPTIVRVKMEGLKREFEEIQLDPGDNSVVFTLSAIESFQDGFESGTLGDAWTLDGEAPWYVTNSESHSGSYAVASGTIENYQKCSLILEYEAEVPMVLTFWYKVDTSYYGHFFYFFINDHMEISASGDSGWQEAVFDLSEGMNILEWQYYKRYSGSGSQGIWFDDVSILEK